jgi:hypothetical protein
MQQETDGNVSAADLLLMQLLIAVVMIISVSSLL